MKSYTIANFDELAELYFHDYELQNIEISYENKEVLIQVLTAGTKELGAKHKELLFSEVVDFKVTMNEPWGSGFYINSIQFFNFTGHIKTIILLNSGDEISCHSKTINIR